MARAFTRKRKPDSPSMSMSLEEHIASTDRNPHPQYVTFGDLGAAQAGVALEYDRANLSGYLNQTTNVVPNAYLANILDQEIISNTTRIGEHCVILTQEDVLNNGINETTGTTVVLPHVDDNGLSLYSARTHTHTLGDLGAAAWNHDHEGIYAPFDHTHPYAEKNHQHSEYVRYIELDSAGMYPNTVNVAANIDTSVDETPAEGEEPIVSESHYDCNNFTSQGNYYLKPTGTDVIENGPGGETDGLLTVYVSTVEDSSYSDIVQFFYGEISWKRNVRIEIISVTETDPETNEEFVTSETRSTFGDWLPLVETLPIGSLMFLNQDGPSPAGYIEANGAQVGSAAYPVLWKFARQRGMCILASNGEYQAGRRYGYYALIYNEALASKVIDESDIGCIVIDTNDFVRELTEDNKASYIGRTLRYIPAENIDDVDFRIPNLGDNSYLQMVAYGDSAGVGFGVSTPAGLPTIPQHQHSLNDFSITNVWSAAAGIPVGMAGGSTVVTGVTGEEFPENTGDANNISGGVYGGSYTVTPKNVSVRVFIKAYNGAIIKSDVAESDIRSIISDLLTQFGYATTTSTGLVRLATAAQVAAGVNTESVITPALLKQATDGYISSIKDYDGQSIPVVDHSVTLPDFAYRKGNSAESLGDVPVSCTAIVDIDDPNNIFRDFDVPYETAYAAYLESVREQRSMLDWVVADVTLKCVSASNAMGYPIGSVIPKPLCSYKSDSEAEYISHPTVILYIDENETYTENNTFNKVKARLYWPLMWYFKKFTPSAGDGSRSFPFVAASPGTDPTIEQIETECAFWNVLINIHM